MDADRRREETLKATFRPDGGARGRHASDAESADLDGARDGRRHVGLWDGSVGAG
jgi:hypothetical protein